MARRATATAPLLGGVEGNDRRRTLNRTPSHEDFVPIIARLQARKPEIVDAVHRRVRETVPDGATDDDPDYQAGVLAAIAEMLDYSFMGMVEGPGWTPSLPPASAIQARRAARAGVGLGAVLRRYVAGHNRLGEIITREACSTDLLHEPAAMCHLHRVREGLLEHLTAAVEDEYNDEHDRISCSPQRHRAEIVQRLLACMPVTVTEIDELGYELHVTWHLGLIARGASAADSLRRLKARMGCQLLCISVESDTLWAWLGIQQKPTAAELERVLAKHDLSETSLVLGEPRKGLVGWRRTHKEARAAEPVALVKPQTLTRCVDVPLEAAVLHVDELAALLIETYVAPLESLRSRGKSLCATLRAYISVGCNAATAAAKLGVDRHTVERHVHAAEDRLGRPLSTCLSELNIALRLAELR